MFRKGRPIGGRGGLSVPRRHGFSWCTARPGPPHTNERDDMALPDPIPVEDLFGPSGRSRASISPDGTRIAYLAPWRNRLNAWVQDLDGGSEPRCVTADETRSVVRYEWADDPGRLLYLQDSGGDENWHLFRVDLDDPGSEADDTADQRQDGRGVRRPRARRGHR
ncbi:hypothetical protein GCM10009602_50230 [Nocardiopsis tropica]